ncbi:MAG: PEP-CTERM sorting domain-containing protein [Nostoc sp.]
MRAVPIAAVPEPSHALGLLVFGSLIAVSRRKKHKSRVN